MGWTIYEQFTAKKLDVPVTMILPPDQRLSLMSEIDKGKTGIQTVRRTLSRISSENAEATFKKDEDQVKGLIRKTIGFAEVDKAVARTMVSWVAEVVQGQFLSYLDDKEERFDEDAVVEVVDEI